MSLYILHLNLKDDQLRIQIALLIFNNALCLNWLNLIIFIAQ